MNLYHDLVMRAQLNYSQHYSVYVAGGTPVKLTGRGMPPYLESVRKFANWIHESDCVIAGGASGLSASCGYNFFYANDALFQRYFSDFYKKYGFVGAFNGFYFRYPSSRAKWAFRARMGCLLYECEAGQPYHDLMALIGSKPYHIITTNQDFLFTHIVPEENLSAIQGDSRYYQCSRCCHDAIYFNREMVCAMNAAIDENLEIPEELIPRCPRCGAELEPWVRGYTFLEGEKYRGEYDKIDRFLEQHKEEKLLFLELGVGRMTPMFIQEPFWNLTWNLPNAKYISVNAKHGLLPKQIEDKGIAIIGNIAQVLKDAQTEQE